MPDAKKGFSDKGLSDKVSGDALYHFGGFFKRSWRSNDILWGRLDCLCQLTETLFNRDRVRSLLETEAGHRTLKGYFISNDPQTANDSIEWQPGMDPARLFPHAGERTQENCRKWLVSLLVGTREERSQRLAKESFNEKFDEMLNLIIEAAQLEVINEELPNVINDALGEQTQWNQFRLTKTGIEEVLEIGAVCASQVGEPAKCGPGGSRRKEKMACQIIEWAKSATAHTDRLAKVKSGQQKWLLTLT